MADQPRTVASITREGKGPQPCAYDAPGLSAIEFLQAVMHAINLPMVTRIKAARALLPYTEPRPASSPPYRIGCRIIIPPLCSPWPRSTGNGSQNPKSPSKTVSQVADTPPPVNFETTLEPDYSKPPSPIVLPPDIADFQARTPPEKTGDEAQGHQPSGELHALSSKEEPEDPDFEIEDAEGDLPNELLEGAPPAPSTYPNPELAKPPVVSQPVAVSLNEE